MTVRMNIAAMRAHRYFSAHVNTASRAMRRIASGYRINSAADDPAGLAISERMRGQIRGLRMASQNAQNGISLLQVAEGGLNETHAILQRMRELAVQASNGTYSDQDRKNIDVEYQALLDEIDHIASATNYNGIKLLDGTCGGKKGTEAFEAIGISAADVSFTGSWSGGAKLNFRKNEDGSVLVVLQAGGHTVSKQVESYYNSVSLEWEDNELLLSNLDVQTLQSGVVKDLSLGGRGADFSNAVTATGDSKLVLQIGANGTEDQRLALRMEDMSASNLGLGGGAMLRETNLLTRENADKAIEVIEKATQQVSSERARIGAQINRLGYTINSLDNAAENLTAAESTIRDADIAAEMMNYTKATILMQAAQAMMAQAMRMPNTILQLLQSL